MKKRILLVDDNISFPEIINITSLSPEWCDIERVHSGHDAVQQLKTGRYDVVLLDLVLPDMDGLDLLKQIKMHIDKHLPIIIINDHGNSASVVEALRYGAYHIDHSQNSAEYIMQIIHRSVEHRDLTVKVAKLQDVIDKYPSASQDQFNGEGKGNGHAASGWAEFVRDDGILNYRQADRVFKSKYFGDLLKLTGGNISRAAEKAGITRQGLHKILNGLKKEA